MRMVLIKMKEESEKVGLKLKFQKTKIMASGPIISWGIDGETVETVSDFIFGAPKSLQVVIAAPKIKSDTVSTVSPSISHEVVGPDAMIFVF